MSGEISFSCLMAEYSTIATNEQSLMASSLAGTNAQP